MIDEERESELRASRTGPAMLVVFGTLALIVAAVFLAAWIIGPSPAPDTAVAPTAAPASNADGSVPVTAAAPAADPNAAVITDNQMESEPAPVEPAIPTRSAARPPISLEYPASFTTGLLHGLIAPISLVLSLLTPTIRAYDPTNIGPLYDFGYLFGVALLAFLMRLWLRSDGRRRSRRT